MNTLGELRHEVATALGGGSGTGRLRAGLPTLRKAVMDKVALAVGAMIEGRPPNIAELANLLPPDTDRQDLRERGQPTRLSMAEQFYSLAA
ncbi:MAG: hypothetical protein V9G98_22230 [Candidatus Competibacter sp.]